MLNLKKMEGIRRNWGGRKIRDKEWRKGIWVVCLCGLRKKMELELQRIV
jgi:hypothetical protein